MKEIGEYHGTESWVVLWYESWSDIFADTTSKLVTLDVPSAAVAAWSGQCAYKASYPGTYDLYFWSGIWAADYGSNDVRIVRIVDTSSQKDLGKMVLWVWRKYVEGCETSPHGKTWETSISFNSLWHILLIWNGEVPWNYLEKLVHNQELIGNRQTLMMFVLVNDEMIIEESYEERDQWVSGPSLGGAFSDNEIKICWCAVKSVAAITLNIVRLWTRRRYMWEPEIKEIRAILRLRLFLWSSKL